MKSDFHQVQQDIIQQISSLEQGGATVHIDEDKARRMERDAGEVFKVPSEDAYSFNILKLLEGRRQTRK